MQLFETDKSGVEVIDQVMCISRRTSSLLTPVMSPAGIFYAVIPVLQLCRFRNLLLAATHLPAGRN
jgi:hypothetical protein